MSLLLSRKSIVPQWMTTPAPTAEDLDYMLRAAVCAPDHGWLRPWRFVVVEGSAREKLAELFVDALLKRNPEATEEQITKERGRPLSAPLVIAVCAVHSEEKPTIPMNERVLSAGAAAQNILLAAHERGFGAIWLTGQSAYDPTVKDAFDLGEEDQIVGFLYIGSVDREVRERKRPDPAEFTVRWGQD